MSSGAVLAVDCYVMGAEMSNADLTSPGIERSRHAHTTALWYRAALPWRRVGIHLSEVYVVPEFGLRLPECTNKVHIEWTALQSQRSRPMAGQGTHLEAVQ